MSLSAVFRSGRLWIATGLILISTWGVLRLWEPSERALHSICFVRQATGVSCPGCGLTRGFASLAKLEISRSIDRHPLTPLLAFEVLILWLGWGFVVLGRASVPPIDSVNRFLVLHAGLLVGVWLSRITSGGVL